MANRWSWGAIALTMLGVGQVWGQEAAPPATPPNAFGTPPSPPPEFCPTPASPFPIGLGPVQKPLPDNGFTEPCPTSDYFCFFTVGTQALKRERLGNGLIAVRDPGVNIPGVLANVDTGNFPPGNAPLAVNFATLSPGTNWGGRISGGVVSDFGTVEFVGFYLAEASWSSTVANAGRLDLPFGTFPAPIGFQGNNNLWLQADQVDTTLDFAMGSAELNYRGLCAPCIEFISGFRYLDLLERYRITTYDDNLVVQPLDQTNVATVSSKVHNRIVGPQLGLAWARDVSPETLSLGVTAKGMWGINFMEGSRSLTRGDGLIGFDVLRTNVMFSHLYELSFHLDWWFTPHWRVRGGYNLMWVVNVPEAHEQINFNLAVPDGNRREHGSIFFYGPMIEVVFVF